MSEYNITVEGGTSKRLLTAGKYCDRDIVVTAGGGGEIETCNVELRNVDHMAPGTLMDYVGVVNGAPQCVTLSSTFPGTIQCVKNTPIVAYNTYGLAFQDFYGGRVEIRFHIDAMETARSVGVSLFHVAGDGWIDLYNIEGG